MVVQLYHFEGCVTHSCASVCFKHSILGVSEPFSMSVYTRLPRIIQQCILFLFGKLILRLYEKEVKERLCNISGNVFIDVGASIGSYSFMLAKQFKIVIAVEPNPKTVLKLEKTIRQRKMENIRVYPYALSNRDGEAPFYLDHTFGRLEGSADTLESAFHYRPGSNRKKDLTVKGEDECVVETRRFDSLFKELQTIDLVKIDVEGSEFKVLEGMPKSLGNIRNLIIELHDRERKGELERFLLARNFQIEWLGKSHVMAMQR